MINKLFSETFKRKFLLWMTLMMLVWLLIAIIGVSAFLVITLCSLICKTSVWLAFFVIVSTIAGILMWIYVSTIDLE